MKRISFVLIFLSILNFCFAEITIEMRKQGGVYYIPCTVNGLPLEFIFDTGASNVCLSKTEALFMLKNNYLKYEDFKGVSYSQIANGELVENLEVTIREITIGNIKLSNIPAVISLTLEAPLLLGQSAIQQLGEIALDGNKLRIYNYPDTNDVNNSLQQYSQAYQRAYQLYEKGDYEGAIKASIDGLNYTDYCLECEAILYDNIGSSYSMLENHELAIEYYNKALEINLNFDQAEYNLGREYYLAKNYEKAYRTFETFISKHKNKSSKYTSFVYAYWGDTCAEMDKLDEAEKYYGESLNLNINNDQAIYGLCETYFRQRKFLLAINCLELAVSIEPNKPTNIKRLFQLGISCFNLEKFDDACLAFSKCGELAYKYGDAIIQGLEQQDIRCSEYMFYWVSSPIWSARARHKQNNFHQCIKQYEFSLENELSLNLLEPQDYVALSESYNQIGELDKAISSISIGIDKFPDNIDLLYYKSRLIKNSEDKIAILNKILEFEFSKSLRITDYGTVFNNVAYEYFISRKYTEALIYAEKAVSRNPEHEYSWETLGLIYFALGKYEETINAMSKCLNSSNLSRQKTAYEYTGNSLINLGKKKEGKKYLKTAKNIIIN